MSDSYDVARHDFYTIHVPEHIHKLLCLKKSSSDIITGQKGINDYPHGALMTGSQIVINYLNRPS